VLVVGLGRFGGALAETLVELGYEVMAIDADAELVQRYSEQLTHVAQADSTDEAALRQLGARDFKRAVVAIGTDIESSILTTSSLVELGVAEIWAKAVTEAHGKILSRVGAHHVVFPEHDMGERIAHVVTGKMIDYIELDPTFALVETSAPAPLVGKTLGEAEVRRRYGITVVCIKTEGQPFTYATAETQVTEGDILVVAGETKKAEAFAALD
jgi:trk system potassium uptake protein TrkA